MIPGSLCKVYVPEHMQKFSPYTALWKSPNGKMCGKLWDGCLVIVIDFFDLIEDDMRLANIVARTGQVGWINVLSLVEV